MCMKAWDQTLTVFPHFIAGSQMSAWSRMSAVSKVIVFQMISKENELKKSARAQRTLKAMNAGTLIRGNMVT